MLKFKSFERGIKFVIHIYTSYIETGVHFSGIVPRICVEWRREQLLVICLVDYDSSSIAVPAATLLPQVTCHWNRPSVHLCRVIGNVLIRFSRLANVYL
jgi:hypothetical protein